MKQTNKPERRPRLRTLKIGLLMTAVGLALMFASGLALMITIPIISSEGIHDEESAVLVLLLMMVFISLLLFMVGIALIVFYYSARDKGVSTKEEKISESQTKE